MIGGERVVVQIGIDDRGLQRLGEVDASRHAVRHDDATARDDDGEFRLGEEVGGFVEALVVAGAAADVLRMRDVVVGLAIEIVAGNVELGGAALAHRHVEAARGEFGHARMLGDMRLIFGDLGEDR